MTPDFTAKAREIALDILDTFRAWGEDQITDRIAAALDEASSGLTRGTDVSKKDEKTYTSSLERARETIERIDNVLAQGIPISGTGFGVEIAHRRAEEIADLLADCKAALDEATARPAWPTREEFKVWARDQGMDYSERGFKAALDTYHYLTQFLAPTVTEEEIRKEGFSRYDEDATTGRNNAFIDGARFVLERLKERK